MNFKGTLPDMNPEHICDIWLSLWLISEETTLKYHTSLFPHRRRTRHGAHILSSSASQVCPTTQVLTCFSTQLIQYHLYIIWIKSHPLKQEHWLLLHNKITCCVWVRSTYSPHHTICTYHHQMNETEVNLCSAHQIKFSISHSMPFWVLPVRTVS